MTKETGEENESPLLKVPESYQRYIDEIYEIARTKKGGWVNNKELAEGLNVEPPSVSGMLKKLKENNYIRWSPRQAIRLTKKGKQIAKQLNETHSLLRTFFKKVLKIEKEETIEDLSCEIEHHISRDVKESFKTFLDDYLDAQE